MTSLRTKVTASKRKDACLVFFRRRFNGKSVMLATHHVSNQNSVRVGQRHHLVVGSVTKGRSGGPDGTVAKGKLIGRDKIFARFAVS